MVGSEWHTFVFPCKKTICGNGQRNKACRTIGRVGLIRAWGTEKDPLKPLKTVAVLTHSVFIAPGAFWGPRAQSLIIITVLPTE